MDEGIFIRARRTLGGFSKEAFIVSSVLTRQEIKIQVDAYLNNSSDGYSGDLFIEEEKCRIWKPSKSLQCKVNIVLAETWSGCGTCWFFACRNEREIREVLRHAINHEHFDTIKAKIYRNVPLLSLTVATEEQKSLSRTAMVKRELT